ncbi:conserved hypothetical protein [Mycobacterium tuberculosis]|nr:conserved hypothetical protein [Mycobacterium tuberculosis]
MVYLERATKDSIVKMLKSALAIQEKHKWGVSRKRELDYLGRWFLSLDDVNEAHRLGAYTYGLYTTRHYQGEQERTSDSGDMSLREEVPITRGLRSRSRRRLKGSDTESVRDHSQRQKLAKEAVMAMKAAEESLLRRWLDKGEFLMSELEPLRVAERKMLLYWISRCVASRSRTTRTPDGLEVRLTVPDVQSRTKLQCEDGELDLPDYRITVREAAVT